MATSYTVVWTFILDQEQMRYSANVVLNINRWCNSTYATPCLKLGCWFQVAVLKQGKNKNVQERGTPKWDLMLCSRYCCRQNKKQANSQLLKEIFTLAQECVFIRKKTNSGIKTAERICSTAKLTTVHCRLYSYYSKKVVLYIKECRFLPSLESCLFLT